MNKNHAISKLNRLIYLHTEASETSKFIIHLVTLDPTFIFNGHVICIGCGTFKYAFENVKLLDLLKLHEDSLLDITHCSRPPSHDSGVVAFSKDVAIDMNILAIKNCFDIPKLRDMYFKSERCNCTRRITRAYINSSVDQKAPYLCTSCGKLFIPPRLLVRKEQRRGEMRQASFGRLFVEQESTLIGFGKSLYPTVRFVKP